MPIAQLVSGNIDANHAVITTDFETIELNSGESYTFTSASRKYLVVNALADLYVAFTSDGTTPNAAAMPRVKIVAGSYFPFAIRSGVKATVVAA